VALVIAPCLLCLPCALSCSPYTSYTSYLYLQALQQTCHIPSSIARAFKRSLVPFKQATKKPLATCTRETNVAFTSRNKGGIVNLISSCLSKSVLLAKLVSLVSPKLTQVLLVLSVHLWGVPHFLTPPHPTRKLIPRPTHPTGQEVHLDP
jgi:hypothetical protein